VGAKLGTRKWWITSARPQRKAPGLWLAQVDLKGWASTKDAKIKVSSTAETQSGENVYAPNGGGGSILVPKVETHESAPTVSVTYLVENISSSGKTDDVGTAQTPPVTVPVSASVWNSLSSFIYHWPNGWVLMGTDQDRIPGTSVALVTDQYKYIRQITPG
jgi:hypothetical protein